MGCSLAGEELEGFDLERGGRPDCRSVPNGAISAARVYTTTACVRTGQWTLCSTSTYVHAHTVHTPCSGLLITAECEGTLFPCLSFFCLHPPAFASACTGPPASTIPGSPGFCTRDTHGIRQLHSVAGCNLTAHSLLLLNGCGNLCLLCLRPTGHLHMHLRLPCCTTPLPLSPTNPLPPPPLHR